VAIEGKLCEGIAGSANQHETIDEQQSDTMIARHVHVTGRVQGVWFRAWTREQARAKGVSGWVRNLPDGSVEGVLAGPEEAVQAVIAVLHDGPPAAKVADVRVAQTTFPDEPGFHIVD
jgi:acylphosphatase